MHPGDFLIHSYQATSCRTVNVDPHCFVFVRIGREFFYSDREFDDLVAGVSKRDCVRSLSDVSDDSDRVVHLAPPVRVSAPEKDTSVSRASAFCCCMDAKRPLGFAIAASKKLCQRSHVKTCTSGAKYFSSVLSWARRYAVLQRFRTNANERRPGRKSDRITGEGTGRSTQNGSGSVGRSPRTRSVVARQQSKHE